MNGKTTPIGTVNTSVQNSTSCSCSSDVQCQVCCHFQSQYQHNTDRLTQLHAPQNLTRLELRTAFKGPMGKRTKPVRWTALHSHLTQESVTRSDLRALDKDTIAIAWNLAIWRFADHKDMPTFTSKLTWTKWLGSPEGVEWQEQWAA